MLSYILCKNFPWKEQHGKFFIICIIGIIRLVLGYGFKIFYELIGNADSSVDVGIFTGRNAFYIVFMIVF